MTRTAFLAAILLLSGCAGDQLNAFAFPDRIVITGPLAEFAENHTERAFMTGHEYCHILYGDADARFVTDHQKVQRETLADACALKLIADAGHDTCLIEPFLKRVKEARPRADLAPSIALAEQACKAQEI